MKNWVSKLLSSLMALGLIFSATIVGISPAKAGEFTPEQLKVANTMAAVLIKDGFTKEAAAVIIGSAWGESKLNPKATQMGGGQGVAQADFDAINTCSGRPSGIGGAAIGLLQWDTVNKPDVYTWICGKKGKFESPEWQMKLFIAQNNGSGEIANQWFPESLFNLKMTQPGYAEAQGIEKKYLTWPEFKKNTNIRRGMTNMVANFERAGVVALAERVKGAEIALKEVNFSGAPSGSDSSSSSKSASSAGSSSEACVGPSKEESPSSSDSPTKTALGEFPDTPMATNIAFRFPTRLVNFGNPTSNQVFPIDKDMKVSDSASISADAKRVEAAVVQNWKGKVASIGDYREGTQSGDHSKGKAVDIMISDYAKEDGRKLGDEVAKYFTDNWKELGVSYVIWYNGMWLPPGVTPADEKWKAGNWGRYDGGAMYGANQLDDNTLHYTHVHVSVEGNKGSAKLTSLPKVNGSSTSTSSDSNSSSDKDSNSESISGNPCDRPVVAERLLKGLKGTDENFLGIKQTTLTPLPQFSNLSPADATLIAEIGNDLDAQKVNTAYVFGVLFSVLGYLLCMYTLLLVLAYLFDQYLVVGEKGVLSAMTFGARRSAIDGEDEDDPKALTRGKMALFSTILMVTGLGLVGSISQGWFFSAIYSLITFFSDLPFWQ